MDIQQINTTLNQLFTKNNYRIIFWYDGDQEFEEILPALELNGAHLMRTDENSALELKIKLELDDPQSRYLVYAPCHEPPPEEDWLFDIRLYSYTFHADTASLILKELNLERQSLRPYIQERKAFFRSQDRTNRLKKWITDADLEADIDIKMLAVTVKADQPEPFSILIKLIDTFCKDGTYDDTTPSRPWTEIEKLGLAPVFWKMLQQTFGYHHETTPGLTDFLIRVFVTDLAGSTTADLPASLAHFQITGASHTMNASVFLSQWRSHTGYFRTYNRVSGVIGKKLKMDEILAGYDIETIAHATTFQAIEPRIISGIRDRIIALSENGFAELLDFIKRRMDSYWATTALADHDAVNLYRIVYLSFIEAIELIKLRQHYDAGFSYPDAPTMFSAYCRELFLFDQRYRKFNELADKVEMGGWDVLKALRDKVEDIYSGWFLTQLGLKWGDFLEPDHPDALLHRWAIPSVTRQNDFYNYHVSPGLKPSSRNRIFVVVSDAFRYEAAEELTRFINGKYRLKAELTPMLGVLPGYTALGMASLLPHQRLAIKDGSSGDILVDGKPCASMAQRSQILSQHEGTAVKAEELMAMSKDKGREYIKPYRLIYIYHDHIDAIGDKAASESNTFGAVRKTIDDLYALVSFIINGLNGTHVLITADHGFIYQEKPPEPIDKSKLDADLKNAVKTHKRFVMGTHLGTPDNVFCTDTGITAKTENSMAVIIPRGTNRFNFVGGARFFHGGAMLQEIVLPLISVSEMKGKHLDKSEVRQVGVSLVGSYKKLVTNRPIYKFIQTEAVSDRMKPLTLKISLRDGNDLISNEETLTFDSTSGSLDERQKSVRLALKAGSYDNKKEYALVLRHTDDTEYDRIPIIIDIAFMNDF